MGETSKANLRREWEGFFDLYFGGGKGIDIGCGTDKVRPNADEWDLYQGGREGDATHMVGVPDEKYDWVYSSHCLEHLDDPATALKNWWRILKPGGHLILFVPHRDLYEKRERPPSRWNMEHKIFFVPESHLYPDVLGLRQLVKDTFLHTANIVHLRVCDEGHTIKDPEVHSDGEYSIEMVVKKQ